MARQTLGAEEWKSILEDWKSSGLPQAEYCRKKGLNIKTFSSWKGKLLDKKSAPAKKPAKAKAKPKKAAARKTPAKSASSKAKATATPVTDNTASATTDGVLVATLPSGVEMRFTCDNPDMLVAAINTLAKIK